MLTSHAPAGAMATPIPQPQWTPPPMQSFSGVATGLPDLTTAPTTVQKEWTGDACIAIALHADTSLSAAFWLERKGTVRSVVMNKSKRLVGAVSVCKDNTDLTKGNAEPIIIIGEDAVKAKADVIAITDVIYPLSFLAETPHSKNKDFLPSDTDGIILLPKSGASIDPLILLGNVMTRIHDHAVKTYTEEVGEEVVKKGKKLKSRVQALTLAIPTFAGCVYRQQVISAAIQAGMNVRNVFGSAEATVVGALFRSQSTSGSGLLHSLSSCNGSALVLFIRISTSILDIAIVECDGTARARSGGGRLGCLRVWSPMASGFFLAGTESREEMVERVSACVGTVLENRAIDAILFEGASSLVDEALAAHSSLASIARFEASDTDCAQGASVLSAAEISSSKEYVQDKEGDWLVSYSLPIGDVCVRYDIGMRVVSRESDIALGTTDGLVEVICSGVPIATERAGVSVAQVRRGYGNRMLILLGILMLVSIVGIVYFLQWYQINLEYKNREKWLTEFYRLHAPTKLENPDAVMNTLKKYEDRMFLLWRKLEKTYGVKYRAPDSIKEL